MNTANFPLPRGGVPMMFDTCAYLNSLSAYQHSETAMSRIDPLKEFQYDDNYVLLIRACPSTGLQNASNVIPANSMFEDQMSVPEGSFLTMVGGVSRKAAGTFGKFRIRLQDVGSQCYLSDDYVNGGNISGFLQAVPATGFVDGATLGQTGNNGLFILPSPIAVSSPGQLSIQIVNMENESVTLDMAFYFAIPLHQHTEVKAAWVSNAQTERNYHVA